METKVRKDLKTTEDHYRELARLADELEIELDQLLKVIES